MADLGIALDNHRLTVPQGLLRGLSPTFWPLARSHLVTEWQSQGHAHFGEGAGYPIPYSCLY